MTSTRIPASPVEAAILAMPQEQAQQTAIALWDALHASHEELGHQQQVLGGWEDCAGCQAANDEGDGSFCCDASKARQRIVRDAWRLR
ncbi:hypothetical protein [Streptomyces sp. NPDC058398]|uniref:hypothetical protein n=1 Tax=Streptomyces sp. NPDC058398 TaxID=3346479 RepID=UPI0036671573